MLSFTLKRYEALPAGQAGGLIFWLWLLLSSATAMSLETAASGDITRDILEEKVAAIEGASDLQDPVRESLLAQLSTAEKYLDKAVGFANRERQLRQAADNAPTRTAEFKHRRAEADQRETAPSEPIGDTLEAINSRTTLIEAELRTLTARRDTLRQEIAGESDRKSAVQARLVEVQTSLADNDAPAMLPDGPLQEQVAVITSLCRTQAWLAEEEILKTEIISEPALSALREAESDWLRLAISQTQERLKLLTEAATFASSKDTEQKLRSIDELERQMQRENTGLLDLVNSNRALAGAQRETAESIDRARLESSQLKQQLNAIREDIQLMNLRLEVAGRKEEIGKVMATLLQNVPDAGQLLRGVEQRSSQISALSLDLIDLEEQRRELADRDIFVAANHEVIHALNEREKGFLNRLLDQRKQLVDNAKDAGDGLLRLLIDNNINAQNIIRETEGFEELLMGNLLWVRSYSNLSPALLREQLNELLSWQSWANIPSAFLQGLRKSPWTMTWLLLLLSISLFAVRSRPAYEKLVSTPVPLSTMSASRIVLATGWSLLLVLPWAFAVILVSRALANADPRTPFLNAVTPAIASLAPMVYTLLYLNLLLDEKGLGRRLLKWNTGILERLRSEALWLAPVLAVTAFVGVFSSYLHITAGGGFLGAIATSVAALAVIAVLTKLLRSHVFDEHRLVKTALQVATLLAVTVIVLQLQGYFYAADVYLVALGKSFFAVMTIKIFADIALRCLLVLKVRVERATRSEIEALKKEGEDALEERDDLENVASLSEANTKLLALTRIVASVIALWFIWEPTLPALNLLDTVELWRMADSSDLAGGSLAISLFDVILAILSLVITGLVATHLPSIIQVVLMDWLDADSGVRYASGILSQYLVVGIGVSYALSLIGWEWSRVQWLVAALGVGIGFGLQEIVANFISGLIILFERPIRVGDIVTVGNTSGTVIKIKSRATIIQTFELKEHLVPNKALITGEVTNWSLSQDAVRVMISVGIAYDDDPDRAMALLLEAAREIDLVLDKPEPQATFDEFGDNGLLLTLRCYVAENRTQAWTALRSLIFRKYTDANINIAFPQRDVHLNITHPVAIQLDPAMQPG